MTKSISKDVLSAARVAAPRTSAPNSASIDDDGGALGDDSSAATSSQPDKDGDDDDDEARALAAQERAAQERAALRAEKAAVVLPPTTATKIPTYTVQNVVRVSMGGGQLVKTKIGMQISEATHGAAGIARFRAAGANLKENP